MNRRQKIIVSVTGIFIVLLLLVGLTYAYFLTRITGNTNDKSISVKTANLALVYGDGNGILEVGEVLVPGDTVKFKTASGDTVDKKTFTVTNEGNATTDYVVVIDNVSVTYTSTVEMDGVTHTAGSATTFESNDFVYTLTCTSGCNGVDTPTTFPIEGGILVGNSIDVEEEQTYELRMTYKETGKDQSNDMNKTLTARVNIKDISTINPYSSNTSTLAYNIINNAKLGATGTTLSAVPDTKVAVEPGGAYGSGKYGNVTVANTSYDWLYADTEAGASSGIPASECTDDLIGKWLYDNQNYFYDEIDLIQVTGCDGNLPMYYGEIPIEEKVLSVTQDDLGTSYYYRGKVEDNYVDFNGMCWRIVRIEGDGAVKLVLEDQDNTCVTSNGNWDIGTGHYGYNQTKVINSSGQESAIPDYYLPDYINSPTNTDTSMRSKFDTWLTDTSGIDTTKLKKDEWCLGNQIEPYDDAGTLLTKSINDLLYVDQILKPTTPYNYNTYIRLYGKGQTANATLRCDGKNDEIYESYIGALTADEVVFAGMQANTSNFNNYLLNEYQKNEEKFWWTLSLMNANDSRAIGVHTVDWWGSFTWEWVSDDGSGANSNKTSLRPAVTLEPNSVITSGNGTKTNPYVVE